MLVIVLFDGMFCSNGVGLACDASLYRWCGVGGNIALQFMDIALSYDTD